MNSVVTQEKTVGSLEEDLRSSINSITIVPVTDAASFAEAGERVKLLTMVETKWSGYWAKLKKSAHETWKGIVAKEKDGLDVLARKKDEQRQIAKAWVDEEERKRLETERIAQAAAKKQAEDDALLAAAALEMEGTPEAKAAAEEIIQTPVAAPQVVAPKTVPAGYGTMIRKSYSAQVTDLMALAKAVVAGKVPVQAIQGNEVFLNAQARQFKSTAALNYPGVQVNVR